MSKSYERVVVAGGAGFIGSHLCGRLVCGDVDVVCVDNLVTGSRANVAGLDKSSKFEFRLDDISADGWTVEGDIDAIFNLASPASPVSYQRFPIQTLKAGSLGTLNTLDLARRTSARYVMASTSEIYGDPLEHPQRESYWGNVNPVGPRSMYDESKRFAEAATTAFHNFHGVSTLILRIFNTYGPRMSPMDGRVISTFLRQSLAGEELTIMGDGSQTRSLCYVGDMVDGILLAAKSDLSGPVNLGGTDEKSVRDLAEMVIDVIGSSSKIVFCEGSPEDPRRRRPDTSVALRDLSWRPRVSFRDGLLRTARWMRQASIDLEE